MKPLFFSNAAAFRVWLAQNHQKKKEHLVGFHKVKSEKQCMTWSESVDEALCYGWIDGVRKSLDDQRYTIRFTPRKPNSIWSLVNVKKMEALTKKGLMQPAGQAIFAARHESRSGVYIHENSPLKLDAKLARKLKSHKGAWDYFQSTAPSYRKVAINWIMSAKQEATRDRRFEKLLKASLAGKKLQ